MAPATIALLAALLLGACLDPTGAPAPASGPDAAGTWDRPAEARRPVESRFAGSPQAPWPAPLVPVSRCVPGPERRPDCAAFGAVFDAETRHCRIAEEALGQFSPALRAACRKAGGGRLCARDRWPRSLLLDLLDVAPPAGASLAEVLSAIRARGDIHCQPTVQDRAGNGIFQVSGQLVPESARSEAVYPPFVLGPRRQVDSLTRQLYLALPPAIRRRTAFVVADRLVQAPESYLPYLLSRRDVVISGSLVGIGSAPGYPEPARVRHADELWKLRVSLALVGALRRPVRDVVYAMGDSSGPDALQVREHLDRRLRRTLAAARLGWLDAHVDWGADETAAIALARRLPPVRVLVHMANPEATHHYDGQRRTAEIVAGKLAQLRARAVRYLPDIELAVFGRRPGPPNDQYAADDPLQDQLDEAFIARFRRRGALGWRRLAIVDGRMFNGAWNARSAPRRCDLLAYGSWGTFGNAVGMTLAAAKILRYGSTAARRQLYLEAVAHDVFANGYAEAQRGEMRRRIDAALGAGTYSHYAGYTTAEITAAVFDIVDDWVNERMYRHFAGSGCMEGHIVRVTPQLWRTFESEVHLWPPLARDLAAIGVYRRDLRRTRFDPRGGRAVLLTLEALIDGT
jgi:hypothetical protein